MLRSLLGALVLTGAILFSPEAEGALPDYSGRYLWSTFIGGNEADSAWDVAQSASGDIYVVGSVGSQAGLSLPAATLRIGPGGQTDVVVLKFSAEGAAEWAVVFGGSGYDRASAVVLGPGGEVFVTGTTDSPDFSMPRPDGSPGTTLIGEQDAFIARVGSRSVVGLDWFVHVGGTRWEEGNDIALEDDVLLIAGNTQSSDMPGGAGAAKGVDGFVTVFDPSPSSFQVLGTQLLSGSESDFAQAIVIRNNWVVVAGSTNSTDLEQRLNTHASPGRGRDAFLAVLTRTPLTLLRTQYVGGEGDDAAQGLDFLGDQPTSDVLLVGSTVSSNFLGMAPQGMDAFVLRYDTASSPEMTRMGGTLLGGSRADQGLSVAWAGASFPSDFYVGGWTMSQDFPLVGALDPVLDFGDQDGFVARFSVSSLTPGVWPSWSTFVGKSGPEAVHAVSFSPQERLVVGGTSSSSELPGGTPGFDPTLSGPGSDMLLASLDLSIGWQPSDGGTQDGGEPWDGGWDGGLPDSGIDIKPGDGGPGPIIKPPDLGLGGGSPLGWSCGCGAFQGPGTLALGALLALGLRASRRRRQGSARSGHS